MTLRKKFAKISPRWERDRVRAGGPHPEERGGIPPPSAGTLSIPTFALPVPIHQAPILALSVSAVLWF